MDKKKKDETFVTIEVIITMPYGEVLYEKMEVRPECKKFDAIRQAREQHGHYAYVSKLRLAK